MIVISLPCRYGPSADVWSAACIVFELATGDLLFTPKEGEQFSKEDDHLALMMELLGMMPRRFALGGKHSRHFFNQAGALRRIRKLHYWPLEEVLAEKYGFAQVDASILADLLNRMLEYSPENRLSAWKAARHRFFAYQLDETPPE